MKSSGKEFAQTNRVHQQPPGFKLSVAANAEWQGRPHQIAE